MWKSAYFGVYQLLNWKMQGETLKNVGIVYQIGNNVVANTCSCANYTNVLCSYVSPFHRPRRPLGRVQV